MKYLQAIRRQKQMYVTLKHCYALRNISTENKEYSKEKTQFAPFTLFASATVALAVYKYFNYEKQKVHLKSEEIKVGEFDPTLPNFTLEQVSKHDNKKDKIWITYKQGVYDITKFVPNHPGGHENVMLAAGSSVEPFWTLYGIHKKPEILALLETMRVGNISADEANQSTKDMSDPYYDDPIRHKALKPISEKPFNAEPHPSILVDSFYTPSELFYVRNHLPVPNVDLKTFELEVEIEGTKKKLTLNMEELKKFPKHSIEAVIMCAGNRRTEMAKIKPLKGLSWGPAAIGNAKWTGVLLRDVLIAAGIVDTDEEVYNHVQFEGLDVEATGNCYGASIPFWRAFDKRCEVLLAFEMNDEPLSRDHGFPVRVIVPGVAGARNVKWLSRIVVSKDESSSHWQQNDYKGFSPTVDWDTVDFTKSPAIQELPVISAICQPQNHDTVTVKDGFITVKGYAWSGGGQKIVRVDVTADQGKTWHVATFDHQNSNPSFKHWAWTLWSAKIPVDPKSKHVELWAKAVDSSYNTQPEDFKNIWNLRGVLGNAYHRINIKLKTRK